MSHTNLNLGSNWDKGEWPDYVFVTHGAYDGARYVPERTGRIIDVNRRGIGRCDQCRNLAAVWCSYCFACGVRLVRE